MSEAIGFTLLGGSLNRLGRRFGLPGDGSNAIAVGAVLAGSLWLVLMALLIAEGGVGRIFSLSILGAHVRLLLAIPLFFICESLAAPRMAKYARDLIREKAEDEAASTVLRSDALRIVRWNDSWLGDLLCVLGAALLSLSASTLHLRGMTTNYDPAHLDPGLVLTGYWYYGVCLPIFRFLLMRWLLQLGLWTYFLWRVLRHPLRLIPTHPDTAGGLGYVEDVHLCLLPFVLGISMVEAAGLAEELSAGATTFETVYLTTAIMIALEAVLVLGPLLLFAPKLWACRLKGLDEYGRLASVYVANFDTKWLRAPGKEELLGTPDLQSLADLANSFNVVRNMRSVPISIDLVVRIIVAGALPMLPLALLNYPIAELARALLERLAGL